MQFNTLLVLIGGWMVSLGCARAEGQLEQSLNGPWQFTTNAEAALGTPSPCRATGTRCPPTPRTSGKGWYRREFVAPADW